MRKKWKLVALGALGLLVAIQLVPVRRDNPSVTADLNAPEAVKSIITASCYDCHSNQTRWPFYSYVAPVSWLIASDVHGARKLMNLSQWGEYPESAQEFLKTQVYKQVSAGEMPPWDYLLLHPKARVSPSALSILKQWSGAQAAAEAGHKP